ncbi:DUF262 domain-containing protein [Lysinibacillus sp. M3]|uniref:DUF262 domain-containing protein n=1 Tax=Lysinibacillus zambalensis TaxID=3160866 RepID=A0ABV1MZT5_9BACI
MKWEDEYYFDPEDIRIESRSLSVNYIMDLISRDEINISTEFNRRSIWTIQQKSLLIESLLLRIPIPSFYFYEDNKWKLHVIDGVQRLTTIYEFINDYFNLKTLNILHDCRNMYFGDLPQKYKYRILQTQLQVNVIDARTPKQIQFEVLRRLNSGGTSLTAQELRNTVATEETRNLLNRMANNYFFQNIINSRNDRFQLQEYALRFIAFFRAYDPFHKEVLFTRGTMGDFLDDHFYEINNDSSYFDTYVMAFDKSLEYIYALLGDSHVFKDLRRNKNLIIVMLVVLSNMEDIKGIDEQRLKLTLNNLEHIESYFKSKKSYKHKVLMYFDVVNLILLGGN